jgi:shikimate kinase
MNLSNSDTSHSTQGNYFLIGFMGSGKSHWGKIWAEANQLSFVDLDAVIEEKAGKTVAAIFELNGEDHFRGLEAEALRACADLQNTIVACGGGTPCFHENMQWMNEHGATIYIACTATEILARVLQEKEKRPLLKKLNQAELLFFIEQKVKEREPFYTQANVTVQSGLLTENSFPEIISTITN